MGTKAPDSTRFDSLLETWRACRDASERGRLGQELLTYLPRLENLGDLPRMCRLLALPNTDTLAAKLAALGTPAVAPLLAVAADPNDEGHTSAGQALREMASWKAIPGLEAAIAETRDDQVKKVASWLLDYQRETEQDARRSSGGVACLSRGCSDCGGPFFLIIVAFAIVLVHLLL